jgi:hypothetical protein
MTQFHRVSAFSKPMLRLRKRINGKLLKLLETDQIAMDLIMALVFHEDNADKALMFAQAVVNSMDDETVDDLETYMRESTAAIAANSQKH